jgi:hypothetical protein
MKKTVFAFLLISLLAVGSGCQLSKTDTGSPVEPAPQPAETVIDLDSPTGGFTFEDEEPAFGEAELYEPFMNELAVEDPYETDPAVKEMAKHRYAKVFRLRAIWGRLWGAYNDTLSAECCAVDWTGGIHLEGGVILVERIIAFDREDSWERVDRSTIRWTSKTCPHIDGMQLRLVVAPGPKDSTAVDLPAVTLTIRTGPYSNTFTLDDLAALELQAPVDRCNNGISINSHIVPPSCPHGYLVGRWRRIDPDTTKDPDTAGTAACADTSEARREIRGAFRGIWISERGRMAGFLRGVYGVNSAGEQVFFGKYVDMSGNFRGILAGRYGVDPTFAALSPLSEQGWFNGHWINRAETVEGRLKGHWTTGRRGIGYFHGIWGMICTNAL